MSVLQQASKILSNKYCVIPLLKNQEFYIQEMYNLLKEISISINEYLEKNGYSFTKNSIVEVIYELGHVTKFECLCFGNIYDEIKTDSILEEIECHFEDKNNIKELVDFIYEYKNENN